MCKNKGMQAPLAKREARWGPRGNSRFPLDTNV